MSKSIVEIKFSEWMREHDEHEIMRAALEDIAEQKLSTEMENPNADFETGFDRIVNLARAALDTKDK